MAELLKFIFVIIEIKIEFGPAETKITYNSLFFENPGKDIGSNLFNVFEKNYLLYFMNIFNFIKYICYSNVKKIMLHVYYYILQLFLIIIFNNMPNKFVKDYLYYHYTLKKSIFKIKKYIMLGYIKKWRF